ncbi:TetR/AcrR family transcriptional regulator [Antrihabitans cavernicola]|uniref:TetR/AcrR family transcriptional regulator n=1 Tax=Antrihabitans cavernicola TaxID=2495913 RepID=A0A5A7SEY3_9NOCA|nr:TetR/AcrR family transcriptional regulator [Spelaeibacter cavernicola]KAA0024406.1 TetR/AcrR family transcriptional regulator [Spelaeibacter cavernicola]
MNAETPATPRSLGGRREQEDRIVKAVRALFDERGLRDPTTDEVARAVGINKATIYRHVASKDELFLLVLCSYQDELDEWVRDVDEDLDPLTQFDRIIEKYIEFCRRYPAYIDCVAGLTARPYEELSREVSLAVMLQVGRSTAPVNTRLARVIAAGNEQAVFHADNPDYVMHICYSSILGVMQLLRLGVGIQEGHGQFPTVAELDYEPAIEVLMRTMHALLGVHGA